MAGRNGRGMQREGSNRVGHQQRVKMERGAVKATGDSIIGNIWDNAITQLKKTLWEV